MTSYMTKIVAELPASSNSILSKFAFRFWGTSIQEDGKIFCYSKFENTEGRTTLGITSALSFVVSIIMIIKTGMASLMERVFVKLMHHYPHYPIAPLEFQLIKEKRRGMAKVHLLF